MLTGNPPMSPAAIRLASRITSSLKRYPPRKSRPSINLSILVIISVAFAATSLYADEQERLRVGRQADGRIVVPTNQVLLPAGRQVVFPGRPVDLGLTDEGR